MSPAGRWRTASIRTLSDACWRTKGDAGGAGALVEQGHLPRAQARALERGQSDALAEAELEYQDRGGPERVRDFKAADAEKVWRTRLGFRRRSHGWARSGEGESEAEEETDGEEDWGPRRQRPSFMIWTTTPWTLPANLAIAVNPRLEYALVKVDGNVTVLASRRWSCVTKGAKAEEVRVLATTTRRQASSAAGTVTHSWT